MFKYTLSEKGRERVVPDKTTHEYFSDFRSYNERILRLLNRSEPMSIKEISRWTEIEEERVADIVRFNMYTGVIKRVPFWRKEFWKKD